MKMLNLNGLQAVKLLMLMLKCQNKINSSHFKSFVHISTAHLK